MNRFLLCATAALVLVDSTDLDHSVQERLYDREHGTWLVSRESKLLRVLLYTGPKVVLATAGGLALVLALGFPGLRARLRLDRRRTLFVLTCLAVVPGTIAALKATNGLCCPRHLERYGGLHPYVRLSELPPPPPHGGRCFPAGHASGGFALMSLFFALPRARWKGLALGLVAGWTTGLYQMANGAHFASHTVVTMFLAWLLILAMARVFDLPSPANR